MERFDVTGALDALLRSSGKDFMGLCDACKGLSDGVRNLLGLKKGSKAAEVEKALLPHLGDKLELVAHGRSFRLTLKRDYAAMLVQCVQDAPGQAASALKKSVPLTKDKFLALLNGLLKEGRLIAELNDGYKARIFPAIAPRSVGPEPLPSAMADEPDVKKREADFFAAFRDLDRGRVFVRICDLRRRLGWAREEFDATLQKLRDEERVQLHAGDVTSMTPDEVADCFVDEFGARKGTVTLRK